MARNSFESALVASHKEPPATLLADQWRNRYPWVYDIFMRYRELEVASESPWQTLTLLERAERDLFSDFYWLIYSDKGRAPLSGTKYVGIQAAYASAAETLAMTLHSYFDQYETDGLLLYRMSNGQLTEMSESDPIGGTNLATLIKVARGNNEYRSAPVWASLLYQKHSDVYWHSLIAGDVWSSGGKEPARDSVDMYGSSANRTMEDRRRMILDQQAVRRATLQAVIRGQIRTNSCLLPPPAEQGKAESTAAPTPAPRPRLKIDEALKIAGHRPEDLWAFRDRFPYLVDLFSRADEIAQTADEPWEVQSLRELAERALINDLPDYQI